MQQKHTCFSHCGQLPALSLNTHDLRATRIHQHASVSNMTNKLSSQARSTLRATWSTSNGKTLCLVTGRRSNKVSTREGGAAMVTHRRTNDANLDGPPLSIQAMRIASRSLAEEIRSMESSSPPTLAWLCRSSPQTATRLAIAKHREEMSPGPRLCAAVRKREATCSKELPFKGVRWSRSLARTCSPTFSQTPEVDGGHSGTGPTL